MKACSHQTFQQNLVKCGVKVYAATMSNPDKLYFGKYKDRRSEVFKGKKGYWAVWDDGKMNAARLVIDENAARSLKSNYEFEVEYL